MDEQRQWHRLFGMSWVDFFSGLPVAVEVEKDLSLKQQLLDVVLIRKGPEPLPVRLPDGFEELAAYNLVSFKSHRQALDGWALSELVGHYVNLRKQVSPDPNDLLPEADFRLFAVCVRWPHNLAQRIDLRGVQEGVYEARHFSGVVRVVVVHQLPQAEHNAMLHLFSASAEQLRYGAQHYRIRSSQTSTFLHQLFEDYQIEGITMPYTREQFLREAFNNIIRNLLEQPAEERHRLLLSLPAETQLRLLLALPAEEHTQLLLGLPAEERERLLLGLPAEERERLLLGLPAEERTQLLLGLPPEERTQLLLGLPAEERERLLLGLPAEERERLLLGLPAEKRLEGVPVEKRLEGVPAEELIKGLAPETLEALRRLLAGGSSTPRP